jgi:hypothetical protein
MFLRFLLAIVGGILITGTILIGMSQFSAMLRERGTGRYFLIDMIPAPERGRPTRPGTAALPPTRDVERLDDGPAVIEVDGIEVTEALRTQGPEAALPELDGPTPERDTGP